MRLIFHAKQLAALDRKAQGIASEIKAKGESRGSMVFIDRKIYREQGANMACQSDWVTRLQRQPRQWELNPAKAAAKDRRN